MADTFKESEINVLTLALHKVLEGLIHNINTPLNLILGYSQQLKKQHPELAQIDKIYQAGLAIDDLIQSCARNIIMRLGRDKCRFDLNLWLEDEIKLFNDVLEIKHKLSFSAGLPGTEVFVESSPLLLSLFLESLILSIKNSNDTFSTYTINISMLQKDENAEIAILIPDGSVQSTVNRYLIQLQKELEDYSGISFAQDNPFAWTYHDSEIRILIPVGEKYEQ